MGDASRGLKDGKGLQHNILQPVVPFQPFCTEMRLSIGPRSFESWEHQCGTRIRVEVESHKRPRHVDWWNGFRLPKRDREISGHNWKMGVKPPFRSFFDNGDAIMTRKDMMVTPPMSLQPPPARFTEMNLLPSLDGCSLVLACCQLQLANNKSHPPPTELRERGLTVK
jgi:hypothetical protein